MSAVRLRFRTELRRHWRSLLANAMLLGLAGSVALATAAGARRTDSAYRRMVAAAHTSDVLVNPDQGENSSLKPAQIAALPMVERFAYARALLVIPRRITSFDDVKDVIAWASQLPVFGYELDRPKLVDGRMPAPGRADEVLVNVAYARHFHLTVGSTLDVISASPERLKSELGPHADPIAAIRHGTIGTRVRLTVVGIGVGTDEVVVDEGFDNAVIMLTPAFYRAHSEDRAGFWGAFVTLRRGSRDLVPFRRAVQDLAGNDEGVAFKSAAVTHAAVQRAIDPMTSALWLFTAVVAIAGLVLVTQAIARRIFAAAADDSTLRTIGFTARSLMAASMLEVAAVATAGGALAFVGAFALSGRFPIGPARIAEPQPGMRFDAVVLVLGALALTGVIVGVAAWPAWRSARGRVRAGATRRSQLARVLANAGCPPAVTTGVRTALDRGRGRDAVPVATTMTAAVGALTIVVAAAVFGASLGHLGTTPRLYGWNWDRTLRVASPGNLSNAQVQRFVAATEPALARSLNASSDVEGWSRFELSNLTLDGHGTPAVGVEPERGNVTPSIVSGRIPLARDEIALGALTMRRLHVRIDDKVTATYGTVRREMRVVGRVVMPALGSYPGEDKTAIGEGAVVTRTTLRQLAPQVLNSGFESFVRFSRRPGTVARVKKSLDASIPSALAAVEPALAKEGVDISTNNAKRPTDVRNYERVRTLPLLLAGVLAALAGAAVLHALVSAVRTRRRELAILRALGFTRAQVRVAVCIHSLTIAAVAIIVGIPLGIISGRLAWSALAASIGAVAEPVLPWMIWIAIPAVLAFSALVALVPGMLATRLQPAVALRSE